MAQVILDDNQPRSISASYSWWVLALIGVATGALYWLLTITVGHFIIEPMFCSSSANASTCSNSVSIAGNVAGILVATIGLGILVRLQVLRPLIIAISTAILLWGLSGWTEGLGWAEIIAWSSILYGLSYVLFSWVSRYTRSVPVLVSAIVIVVLARIVLAL